MNYLLDTNICIHYFKGQFGLKEKIEKIGFHNFAISEITLAELIYGAEKSQQKEQNIKVVEDFALRSHGAVRGNGVVKDEFLFTVQDAGQIDVGQRHSFGHHIVDRGDGKAGNDFKVFFVAVLQIGKSGAHAKGVQHGILPGVVLGNRADFFSDSIKI